MASLVVLGVVTIIVGTCIGAFLKPRSLSAGGPAAGSPVGRVEQQRAVRPDAGKPQLIALGLATDAPSRRRDRELSNRFLSPA